MWSSTAWPEGGTAALTAAVFSSFFASQDDPVPAIVKALLSTLAGIAVGGLYLFGVLPECEPWTRNGRLRADVAKVAPDVSGQVTSSSWGSGSR